MLFSPLNRLTPRRLGLTLMELVVVLIVLIGLAGIIIPMIPNMAGRTENSTGATNHTEIAKWVQAYEGLYLEFPNDWDLLLDGTSTPLKYVRGMLDLQAATLTAAEGDSLDRNGIKRLQKMLAANQGFDGGPSTLPSDFHRTFNPYASSDLVANGVATAPGGISVLTLNLAGQKKLNVARYDSTGAQIDAGKFVVLGLGKRCSLVGKIAVGAPVAFKERGVRGPDDVYCRFAAIFQVSALNPNSGAIESISPGCKFIGTCNFKANDKGIFTTEYDIEDYYRLETGTARP